MAKQRVYLHGFKGRGTYDAMDVGPGGRTPGRGYFTRSAKRHTAFKTPEPVTPGSKRRTQQYFESPPARRPLMAEFSGSAAMDVGMREKIVQRREAALARRARNLSKKVERRPTVAMKKKKADDYVTRLGRNAMLKLAKKKTIGPMSFRALGALIYHKAIEKALR
ncbi:hypothetical protein N8343_08330 [Akkermansiaceae bacterium]|nr:hypothetical protein [Akkermansiaceae bacterium]